jgi:hypothetical protein
MVQQELSEAAGEHANAHAHTQMSNGLPSSFPIHSGPSFARSKSGGARVSLAEVGKVLGLKWRQLSDSDKAKYKDIAIAQARCRIPPRN